MAKMGYKMGSGLGKLGEGRVEPVEVTILPEGNISLDKVMELKVNNKLKRINNMLRLKRNNRRRQKYAQRAEAESSASNLSVFEFLNDRLVLRKEKPKDDTKQQKNGTNESIRQASKEDLNVQVDFLLNLFIAAYFF